MTEIQSGSAGFFSPPPLLTIQEIEETYRLLDLASEEKRILMQDLSKPVLEELNQDTYKSQWLTTRLADF